MHEDGEAKTSYEVGCHYWLSEKELKSFLDPNVNKNQEYLIPEKEIKNNFTLS